MRALVLVVVCVACGGSQKPPPPLSATWSAPTMLSKVPADSPYLVAVLDPMPELLRRQTYKALDQKLAAALAEIDALGPEGRSESGPLHLRAGVERAELTLQQRWLLALRDELGGSVSSDWGRALGFDPSGRFALYGLSVWPVLRVAVADEQRLRRALANIIKKSKTPAVEHTLQGRAYWQSGDNKLAYLASVLDHEIVFAMLPTSALPQYLPIVLGMQRPPRSLHDDNRLAALLGRYKLLTTMVGYVDLQIAADILTQRAASTATELDRPLRDAMGPVDQSCKTDIDRLVEVAPRAVFGYRRYDAKGMHARVILEMPAHAALLQRLRVPVPELTAGLGEHALARFGVAMKLDELLPLLRRITDHVGAQPFTCSWFTPFNRAAEELADLLAKQVPAPLFGFRGFSLVVDDVNEEPLMVNGHAIVVGDHAHDLVNLLLRLVPGAGGVTVPPNERPVQLPLAALGVPPSINAYVATRVDRAAVAVGPKSAIDVLTALKAPLPASSPLISIAFDMQRMLELEVVKPDDASRIRDVAMQLEVTPDALVVEMYATFPSE